MAGDVAQSVAPEGESHVDHDGVAVGTVEVLIDHPSYQGPERRVDHILWREQVDRRLDAGTVKMRSLHSAMEENTSLTKKVQADTSELVSLLKSFQGAFKVFNMIGKAARPLGYIAAAAASIAALVTALKGGGLPK